MEEEEVVVAVVAAVLEKQEGGRKRWGKWLGWEYRERLYAAG